MAENAPLLDRLIRAEEPSRALDGLIGEVAGWEWHGDGDDASQHGEFAGHWAAPNCPANGSFNKRGHHLCDCEYIDEEFGNADDVPAFTSSVDDALEFARRMLPSWHVELVVYSGDHYDCTTYPFGLAQAVLYRYVENVRHYHSSQVLTEKPFGPRHPPAMAICIAALKALNSQDDGLAGEAGTGGNADGS